MTTSTAAALAALRTASEAANAYADALRIASFTGANGERATAHLAARAAVRASQLRAALWELSRA